MVAGLASVATPKGLESELMGLPRDVATHIEIAGFTSILSMCSTFTPSGTTACRRPAWCKQHCRRDEGLEDEARLPLSSHATAGAEVIEVVADGVVGDGEGGDGEMSTVEQGWAFRWNSGHPDRNGTGIPAFRWN